MAEALFRKAVEGRGDYATGSAGVSAMRGGPANPETAAILKKRGISLQGFRSRQVSEEILEEATHVFAMTKGHLRMLEAEFPEYSDKFHLVCEFADIPGKGIGIDVPDPIGMGRAAYEETAAVFDLALPAIVKYIDQTYKKA